MFHVFSLSKDSIGLSLKIKTILTKTTWRDDFVRVAVRNDEVSAPSILCRSTRVCGTWLHDCPSPAFKCPFPYLVTQFVTSNARFHHISFYYKGQSLWETCNKLDQWIYPFVITVSGFSKLWWNRCSIFHIVTSKSNGL